MFYSHDLLGRKTALGAIWTMAHGKKIAKNKLLDIDIVDVCDQIIRPDVPHSLRLQGILIGGVVIVFNKQQLFLLEDLKELMKRVRTVINQQFDSNTNIMDKSKQKAKLEAITLMDADNLDAQLQLNDMPMFLTMPDAMMPQMDDDSLLVVPTQTGPSRSRGTTQDTSRLLHEGLDLDMYGNNNVNQWDLQPETFDVPATMLDAQEGLLDLDEMNYELRAEQQAQDEMMAVPEDLMPELDLMMMDELPVAEHLAMSPAMGKAATTPEPSLGQSERDAEEAAQLDQLAEEVTGGDQTAGKKGKAAARVRKTAAGKAGGKRRGTSTLLVDDLDNLQIRSRTYREWTTDASDLMVTRPVKKARMGGQQQVVALMVEGQLQPVPAAAAAGACEQGAPWCRLLLDVFRRVAAGEVLVEAQEAQSPGGTSRPRRARGPAQYCNLPLEEVPWGQEVPEGEAIDPEQAVLEHELLDNVGDLPFADMEMERLRAAQSPRLSAGVGLTPTGSDQLLDGPATGRRASRATTATTTSSASLMPESEARMMRGGRLHSRDLAERDEALAGLLLEDPLLEEELSPVRFGGGALEDLLPTLPESDLDLPSHLLPSGSKGALLGTGLHTVPSALARGPTSQFPLFSETAGMTQAGPGLPKESINKATTMVLQIFRQRLFRLQSQEQPDPQLSFFDLVRQLSRQEATKLFYQVCVTSSTGFVRASQARAYGDITIQAGRFL